MGWGEKTREGGKEKTQEREKKGEGERERDVTGEDAGVNPQNRDGIKL